MLSGNAMPQLTATPSDRLEIEKRFHDKQATCIKITPGSGGWVDCEIPTWHNEPKISPLMAQRMRNLLGDVAGKRVLVLGCGFDPAPTWFARRGAEVTAIDVSPESLNAQKILADGYKVHVDLRLADALNTPFPDRSFDIVYGNVVLHHLDTEGSAREIKRLLAPGGVAIFREVQAGTIIQRIYRKLSPRWRTPGAHPLTEADYKIYGRHFRTVNITQHVFTSQMYLFAHRMSAILLEVMHIDYWPPESKSFLRMCDRIDRMLTRLPGMKSQMWYSLIEMRN